MSRELRTRIRDFVTECFVEVVLPLYLTIGMLIIFFVLPAIGIVLLSAWLISAFTGAQ